MSPGQPDAAVIRRHLAALDASVQQLRTHTGVSADVLRSDRDRLWAVERGLQLAVQNALDIATHLAASQGMDVADYASSIDALAALGIAPKAFTDSFRDIAGFRNVLVHGYLQVDVNIVHRAVNNRLDDFVVFAQHVEQWLQKS